LGFTFHVSRFTLLAFMEIIVQKYGGTSVGTTEKIQRVAERILAVEASGTAVVAVVSAMGHTTDRLIEMARQLTAHPPRREMDMLLSTGEQVSIALLSMAIHERGGRAISMTGLQSGIITDNRHSEAKIREIKTPRILKPLKEGKVVIVAGFQGVSRGTEITTLGRGGSDTTAAALAAALKATSCEIYTDVDGVYTADPNIVPDAVKLDYISYEEMLELAGSGAQVLHPRAVEIATKFNLPLKVKPAHSLGEGTTVLEGDMLEKVVVTGVTADKDMAKIAIQKVPDRPGIAAKLFGALAREGISVHLIIQSIGEGNVTDVTIVLKRESMKQAVDVLREFANQIKAQGVIYEDDMAEISIVGSGMVTAPGVAAKMFRALAKQNINIELISTSHIRISCVIKKQSVNRAIKAIHEEFKLNTLTRRLKV
jgi:aspartate kinase